MAAVPEDGASGTNHSRHVNKRTDSDCCIGEGQKEEHDTIILEDGRPAGVKVLQAAIGIPAQFSPANLMKVHVVHVRRVPCTLVIHVSISIHHIQLICICIIPIGAVGSHHPVDRDSEAEDGCRCLEA